MVHAGLNAVTRAAGRGPRQPATARRIGRSTKPHRGSVVLRRSGRTGTWLGQRDRRGAPVARRSPSIRRSGVRLSDRVPFDLPQQAAGMVARRCEWRVRTGLSPGIRPSAGDGRPWPSGSPPAGRIGRSPFRSPLGHRCAIPCRILGRAGIPFQGDGAVPPDRSAIVCGGMNGRSARTKFGGAARGAGVIRPWTWLGRTSAPWASPRAATATASARSCRIRSAGPRTPRGSVPGPQTAPATPGAATPPRSAGRPPQPSRSARSADRGKMTVRRRHARDGALRATRDGGRAFRTRWTGDHARCRVEAEMRCLEVSGERIASSDSDRHAAGIRTGLAIRASAEIVRVARRLRGEGPSRLGRAVRNVAGQAVRPRLPPMAPMAPRARPSSQADAGNGTGDGACAAARTS